MKGGISKRIGLFLLIFGVPLAFLLVLSRGDSQNKRLKFYGKQLSDTGRVKINDFLFYDADSNAITKETFKGKTIIVTTLIPSCPTVCPIISQQVGEFIYNKISNETRLKDFVILSQLVDTSGNSVDLKKFVTEQPVNADKWKIVIGDNNPIYDFDLPKANLKDNNPSDVAIGGKTYYKMVLLIDKNHYLRGIYQGDKTMEIERLNQEMRVLEREYKDEQKLQKQQNK